VPRPIPSNTQNPVEPATPSMTTPAGDREKILEFAAGRKATAARLKRGLEAIDEAPRSPSPKDSRRQWLASFGNKREGTGYPPVP
jgi:hypothetical protein